MFRYIFMIATSIYRYIETYLAILSSDLATNAIKTHYIHWKRTAAYSPDINTIELVWSDLQIFLREKKCRSFDEIALSVRLLLL